MCIRDSICSLIARLAEEGHLVPGAAAVDPALYATAEEKALIKTLSQLPKVDVYKRQTLSPLSASFTTSYPTWGDERGIFALAEIELVFQDGSTVSFDCGSGNTSQGPDGEGGVVYFTGVYSRCV